MPSLPIEGGCLCAAIRYRAAAPPLRGAFCHCRTCRRFCGGLSMAVLQLAGPGFSFTSGEPRYWRSSPVARRGHCETCGSPILFKYDSMPDVWVLIGTLDDPERWPMSAEAAWGPVAHTQVDDKIPWVEIDDGLPRLTSRQATFRDEASADPS